MTAVPAPTVVALSVALPCTSRPGPRRPPPPAPGPSRHTRSAGGIASMPIARRPVARPGHRTVAGIVVAGLSAGAQHRPRRRPGSPRARPRDWLIAPAMASKTMEGAMMKAQSPPIDGPSRRRPRPVSRRQPRDRDVAGPRDARPGPRGGPAGLRDEIARPPPTVRLDRGQSMIPGEPAGGRRDRARHLRGHRADRHGRAATAPLRLSRKAPATSGAACWGGWDQRRATMGLHTRCPHDRRNARRPNDVAA
jgi:hypothetical protein